MKEITERNNLSIFGAKAYSLFVCYLNLIIHCTLNVERGREQIAHRHTWPKARRKWHTDTPDPRPGVNGTQTRNKRRAKIGVANGTKHLQQQFICNGQMIDTDLISGADQNINSYLKKSFVLEILFLKRGNTPCLSVSQFYYET